MVPLPPYLAILTLPGFTLLASGASLGPGLIIAALNVRFRDFRFVTPFLVQLSLYLSPVGFSSTLIREKFGNTVFLLYSLNPMVGAIDGFRWAILRAWCADLFTRFLCVHMCYHGSPDRRYLALPSNRADVR